MTDFELEGWTDFGGAARKFHYVPADKDTALCGKWGISFLATRAQVRLQPDTGTATPEDCKMCRRRLDARREKG